MVTFLQGQGLSFRRCEGYSDYYPDAKGGKARRRSIEGVVFDGHCLGDGGKRHGGHFRTRLALHQHGGEKVYPEEVEDALRSHPAVRDANVVGLADDVWNEA
jgi:hypothetical protein